MQNMVWPPCNHEYSEQTTAEFYNRETLNNLEYTVTTHIRNYLPIEVPII